MARLKKAILIFGAITNFCHFAYARSEQTCLARAIYFEAGHEPIQDRIAVGDVILNRLQAHFGGARSVCQVIYQRGQFAFTRHSRLIARHRLFRKCQFLAGEILSGSIPPILPNQVLYFNNRRAHHFSRLVHAHLFCVIGNLAFYG